MKLLFLIEGIILLYLLTCYGIAIKSRLNCDLKISSTLLIYIIIS